MMVKNLKMVIGIIITLCGCFAFIDVPVFLHLKQMMQHENIIDNVIINSTEKVMEIIGEGCTEDIGSRSFEFDHNYQLLTCKNGIDIVEFRNNGTSNITLHLHYVQWDKFLTSISKILTVIKKRK